MKGFNAYRDVSAILPSPTNMETSLGLNVQTQKKKKTCDVNDNTVIFWVGTLGRLK